MATAKSKRRGQKNKPRDGLGVDYRGNPVIDPTANVVALSEASAKRQDDLLAAYVVRTECEFRRLDDLRKAQDDLRAVENKRLDELRAMESRRLDEQMILRATYEDKLALAEANRINAIRAVDVGAVAVVSDRATQQASVLANQVAASADTLRTLVASTAATMATTTAATMSAMATQAQNTAAQFTDRLAQLERASTRIKAGKVSRIR